MYAKSSMYTFYVHIFIDSLKLSTTEELNENKEQNLFESRSKWEIHIQHHIIERLIRDTSGNKRYNQCLSS